MICVFLIYFSTNRRIYSRKALKQILVNYYFGGFRRAAAGGHTVKASA